MRKDAGLELTDRIQLTIPAADEDLLEHAEWIASETLADLVECREAERLVRAGLGLQAVDALRRTRR